MSDEPSRFAYIPEWVIQAIGSDGPAMLVYCHLALFRSNQHQYVFPSEANIANYLNISDRSVRRAIRSLEKAGVLVTMASTGCVNQYLIPISKEDVTHYETPDKYVRTPRTNMSGDPGQICPPINTSINTKNNTNKDCSKSTFPKTLDDVRQYASSQGYPNFDTQRFWAYYNSEDRDAWTFKDGSKVKDWRACVRTWLSRLPKPDSSAPESEPDPEPDPFENNRGAILEQIRANRAKREVAHDE